LTENAIYGYDATMKRTTVMVDEGIYAELETFARRDGVSTGRLIREAMERYVTDRQERNPEGERELPSFVGSFELNGPPWAEDTTDYLREHYPRYLEEKHGLRPRRRPMGD
jgi:hypothetical protein